MIDQIDFFGINRKLGHEEIYNLIKTYSSIINKEISEKIDLFKHYTYFVDFYSAEDIKNLINIFKLKLSEDNTEFFSSFKSVFEQHLSCISQIILLIKLFLKTHDELAKIIIKEKNNLSKVKNQNKFENYNQGNLFLYLESLLKIYEKNSKICSNASALINSNISSFEISPKNSLYRTFSDKYKIDNFSNNELELIIHDKPPTPKFKLESKKEKVENPEKTNWNLENSKENYSSKKSDSIFTFSKCDFDEETITPKIIESKLFESTIVEPKIKIYNKRRISQKEYINKQKNKRSISSKNETKNKNNNISYYKNLLEMISKIYKKGLINTEEKVKLKQLIIKKSKKVKYFYFNIYKNSKNDINTLLTEIKKILN